LNVRIYPGCASQGDTVEAFEMITDAIMEGHLEILAEDGEAHSTRRAS
jgi:predicted RNase H-like HicB family nuclease